MYFPTAILLQDAVYMCTNFSEWNSDPCPRSTFEHTVKVILSHGIEILKKNTHTKQFMGTNTCEIIFVNI